jgi:two-component system chemotaxis sensor kinase CheA
MLAEALTAGGAAEEVAEAAAEAAAVAAAFGLDGIEQTALLLADLAERAADPDAAAVLAAQGPGLADRLRAAAEGGAEALRATAEPQAIAEAQDPRIPAAFAPLLGAEGRRRVIAALEAGRALYRLRLATLVPPEAEAAVAAVLSAEAEVLTSRTRLDGDPSHLDMLVAGPPELDALSRALTSAIPARQVVLDLAPAEVAAQEAGVAGRAAPVTMRVRQETIDQIIALEAEVRAAALALGEALEEGGGAEAIQSLAALERARRGAWAASSARCCADCAPCRRRWSARKAASRSGCGGWTMR